MKLVYLAFQGLTLLGLHFFLASFLVSGLDELGPKHQNILFVIEGRNAGLVFSISFKSPTENYQAANQQQCRHRLWHVSRDQLDLTWKIHAIVEEIVNSVRTRNRALWSAAKRTRVADPITVYLATIQAAERSWAQTLRLPNWLLLQSQAFHLHRCRHAGPSKRIELRFLQLKLAAQYHKWPCCGGHK